MAQIPEIDELTFYAPLANTSHASVNYENDERTRDYSKSVTEYLIASIICRSNQMNIPLRERAIEDPFAVGEDSHAPVFRWSVLPPTRIFDEGFTAHESGSNTDLQSYFDYKDHLRASMLFSRVPSAFIKTSSNINWNPPVYNRMLNVYCYKIFAPGGLVGKHTIQRPWIELSDPVSFVRKIDPCYIHSACQYQLQPEFIQDEYRWITSRSVVDEVYYINTRFSPGPHLFRGNITSSDYEKFVGVKHVMVYPPYCVSSRW